MNLGVERRLGNLDQDVPLLLGGDLDLEGLQDLESLGLGHLEAFGDDARVKTFADVELGLLQELADEQHGGGGAVAGDVILNKSSTLRGEELRKDNNEQKSLVIKAAELPLYFY